MLTHLPKLGNSRRATVTVYNKKTFVNIREYYTDNSGELKPGKKVCYFY